MTTTATPAELVITASAATNTYEAPTPAYLSIPVPPALARMWPKEGRTAGGDSSAPHVTLLYMPHVTAEQRRALEPRFRQVLAAFRALPIELAAGVDSFRDGRNADRHVISKRFHPKTEAQLRALHQGLLAVARGAGVEVSKFSGAAYSPHTTLAYSDSPEWRGAVPHGGWTAGTVTLHHEADGDDVEIELPLGAARTAQAGGFDLDYDNSWRGRRYRDRDDDDEAGGGADGGGLELREMQQMWRDDVHAYAQKLFAEQGGRYRPKPASPTTSTFTLEGRTYTLPVPAVTADDIDALAQRISSEAEWYPELGHEARGTQALDAVLDWMKTHAKATPRRDASAALRAQLRTRQAGRARYVAGEVAGEFPFEHASVGDRCRFVADFTKLGEGTDEDGPTEDGVVVADQDGEVTEVYPDGPSFLVRTTLRRPDGSMVPDVLEVPPEAVMLVLAAGDPRAKSAAREVAQRVLALVGFVRPRVVRIATLHAAATRRVAAADRRQALDVLRELRGVSTDTWARWASAVAPPLKVALRRVAGLQARTVELARWALAAVAQSGKRTRGRALDPASREDVMWALAAVRDDLQHGLPEHVYADPAEQAELKAAIAELDFALSEVDLIPASEWSASAPVESPLAHARTVVDQHYKALSQRTRARQRFIDTRRSRDTEALLDAERAYATAELWVRAVEDWLSQLPPEVVAQARAEREPDPTGPVEDRPPIPETRAREVEDDEGLPGRPMGTPPAPEPVLAPSEPASEAAPAEVAAPTRPGPTLIWGYTSFMDRNEWRFERVKAREGLRVRNKNSDEVGEVVSLPSAYTLRVRLDGGRTAIWEAAETAVDKSVKTPLPMASKTELRAWRDGLREAPRTAGHASMAVLAAGLEESDAASMRWLRTAQRTGLVQWHTGALALVAEVEGCRQRMVDPGASGARRVAQEAAVWMLLPVQPGATKLPVARELIHRAAIEGNVAHGPAGVDYAYTAGQNEVTAADGRKAAVYAEQGQAYQAFLDTMLRPWLKLHADDETALPVAALDKMYRGAVE